MLKLDFHPTGRHVRYLRAECRFHRPIVIPGVK